MDAGLGATRVPGVAGGAREPVEERRAFGHGMVVDVGEDVAAAGSDRDDGDHRVGIGQLLVARLQWRAGVQGAAFVRRVQAEVGAQAALAVVHPAELPSGPGEPEQPPPGRAGAHGHRRAFLGEDEEQSAGGVDEGARLAHVVVVPGAFLEPVAQDERQNRLRAAEQVEIEADGAEGGAPALVPIGARGHEGGPVAHQRPASARRAAAVFEAS